MTTTHTDPSTISFDGETFVGRANDYRFDGTDRTSQALRDRLTGMTWREIANRHGYRSAAVAEYNVGRLVAWLNGQRTVATATNRTTPAGSRMSTRRYGVEIEFVGCTMAAAAAAITDALGRQVDNAYGYHTARSWTEWRIESDGSVTQGSIGGEAVSPVLSGQEGLDEIKTVMAAIKSVGGRVSVRTGMHVHVDATDLNGEQIARTLCAYVDRQPAFDRMVSPSRRSTDRRNNYCGPIGETEKSILVDHLKDYRDVSNYYGATRYRTVNVTCLGRTGTVEFRQHQGTLNAAKAIAWVKTLLALVESVVEVADEHLPFDAPELIESLTGFGLDDRSARYMTSRLETIAA